MREICDHTQKKNVMKNTAEKILPNSGSVFNGAQRRRTQYAHTHQRPNKNSSIIYDIVETEREREIRTELACICIDIIYV